MEYNVLEQKLENIKKGAFASITYEKKLATRKGVNDVITKRTRANVRTGINYGNLKSTKLKRMHLAEQGMTDNTEGKGWGEWQEFPFLIKHIPKGETKEKQYLSVYFGKGTTFKTEYFINGNPVSKKDIIHLCLASEMKEKPIEKEVPRAIDINNIVSIKQKGLK